MNSHPPPQQVAINTILISDPKKARETILKHGAAVYILDTISKSDRDRALSQTKFYANTNNLFKDNIVEPTFEQKLHPKTIPMCKQ